MPSRRPARRARRSRGSRRRASRHVIARAVGTPASTMSTFENAFDVSSIAPARVGPKIGRPSARNASTMPARERRFRTDQRPVDAVPARANDSESIDVRRADRDARRQLGDPGIARRGEDLERWDRPAAGARRAHARARRRPRATPSSIAPRRADGVLRAVEAVLERLDRLAGLLAVIAGGVGVVFLERMVAGRSGRGGCSRPRESCRSRPRVATAATPPREPCAWGACA